MSAPIRRATSAWRRHTRTGLLIGVLCGLLGFGLAVQVRSTRASALPAARQEDLVRILDDLSAREDRLRGEIGDLQAARQRLTSDQTAAALQEARQRADALGVLAGTLPARGPGLLLTISEGTKHIPAEVLLDTVEELRGAGAEAISLTSGDVSVRVGTSTWFTDRDRGVTVDRVPLSSPYQITAIGDPATMAAALDIPGGVSDTVRQAGGSVRSEQRREVTVSALRPLPAAQYARPGK